MQLIRPNCILCQLIPTVIAWLIDFLLSGAYEIWSDIVCVTMGQRNADWLLPTAQRRWTNAQHSNIHCMSSHLAFCCMHRHLHLCRCMQQNASLSVFFHVYSRSHIPNIRKVKSRLNRQFKLLHVLYTISMSLASQHKSNPSSQICTIWHFLCLLWISYLTSGREFTIKHRKSSMKSASPLSISNWGICPEVRDGRECNGNSYCCSM